MFKYISEILSQFTAPQRILALLILVFSIVIITLGPSFIDSITLNQEEFQQEIEKQESLNQKFKDEIQTLNLKIIENQRKCTDDIIAREMEIMQQIEDLKRRVGNSSQQNAIILNPTDTVTESYSPIMLPDPRPDMMMEGLNRIQNSIRRDVNSRGGN
jgi:cell division protein FtsB